MKIKKILKILTGFCLINIATAAIGEGFARSVMVELHNQNIFRKGNKNSDNMSDLDSNRKILARKRLDKAEKDSAQANIDKLTHIENQADISAQLNQQDKEDRQARIRAQLDDEDAGIKNSDTKSNTSGVAENKKTSGKSNKSKGRSKGKGKGSR